MGHFASGVLRTLSSSVTRPADTTAYASGDLAANSTTAASVTSMSFSIGTVNGGGFSVRRARIKKSGTSTTNASFRLHLFTVDPASLASGIANGDNGAFSTKGVSGYLGAFDVTVGQAFVDGAAGIGAPISGAGTEVNGECGSTSQTIYGLLEVRGAYTPASAEVFTVELEAVVH